MMIASLLLGSNFALSSPTQSRTQDPWAEPRRGSWVRKGITRPSDLVLARSANDAVAIVLPPNPASNLRKAAQLFREDLAKLGVNQSTILDRAPSRGVRVQVQIRPNAARPEAYTINTDSRGLTIVGTDAHGAAFGLYELSERLGIDPLHIWTGFTPTRRFPLVVKATKFDQGPAAVRWRGLFHDDEDILPRPIGENGIPPFDDGKVPKEWYERFFETALRLRMNMVAPWVRTQRTYDIQKMASDWGLAYTSHHYDVLLSDPYHFPRGLAEKRGVERTWDWMKNREGMIRYWKAGADENRDIDAIYPIGLRGTNDYGYRFPADWTEDRRIAAFNEALATQARLVDEGLPKGKPRRMHFTMYTEMLPYFQTGGLKVPEGTIIVWPDDNDGRMRGLPPKGAPGKHGVYYHLAYYGGDLTKQTFAVVPPSRTSDEFQKIFRAGATEYILTNVSEVREYVLGTRQIADLMWHGKDAYRQPGGADRFLLWWSREYFGETAAPLAAQAIREYFDSLENPESLGYGAQKVMGALGSLRLKLEGKPFHPANADTRPMLKARQAEASNLKRSLDAARAAITDREALRFFEESVELPAATMRLNVEAALILLDAMEARDREKTIELSKAALVPLRELEVRLRRAERPPFERWYGPTAIAGRSNMVHNSREWLIEMIQKAGG